MAEREYEKKGLAAAANNVIKCVLLSVAAVDVVLTTNTPIHTHIYSYTYTNIETRTCNKLSIKCAYDHKKNNENKYKDTAFQLCVILFKSNLNNEKQKRNSKRTRKLKKRDLDKRLQTTKVLF